MKKPSIFPSLPKNLTDRELRKEIRRRLKISEELGLIRKPKKSDLELKHGLAALAKSRQLKEGHVVDFMVERLWWVKIIRIISTVIAPRNREGKLLTVTPT